MPQCLPAVALSVRVLIAESDRVYEDAEARGSSAFWTTQAQINQGRNRMSTVIASCMSLDDFNRLYAI